MATSRLCLVARVLNLLAAALLLWIVDTHRRAQLPRLCLLLTCDSESMQPRPFTQDLDLSRVRINHCVAS